MAIFTQMIKQTYNHNSLKGVKTPLQLVSSVKIVGLCGEKQLAQTLVKPFKTQIEENDPHSRHTHIFNRLLRIGFSEVYVRTLYYNSDLFVVSEKFQVNLSSLSLLASLRNSGLHLQ